LVAINLENPTNNEKNVSLSPELRINATSGSANDYNVTFYDASDDSIIGTNTGVAINTSSSIEWTGLDTNTTYDWYVNVTTSSGTTTSSIWNFTTIDAFTINSISPANGTQHNEQFQDFDINLTSAIDYNVSLYIDSTLKETKTNFTNGTRNHTFTVEFDDTEALIDYYFEIETSDKIGTSQTNSIYIDTIDPTIKTTFVNNSMFVLSPDNTDVLETYFNFTDSFSLSSVNISIDGTQVHGNDTLDGTFYEYNLSENIDDYSLGEHYIFVRSADGHTAKELKKPYNIKNGLFNNYLSFEVDDIEVEVYEKDKKWGDDWKAKREKDRYLFEYKSHEPIKGPKTFIVESNKEMKIMERPDSEYKRWLIMGDHWLDFVPEGIPHDQWDVKLKRLDDKTIRAKVYGLDGKKAVTFHSIGDLNVVTKNYTFQVTNASVEFANSVIEKSETNNILTIDKTNENDTTTTDFVYNNTLITDVEKTSNSTHDKYNATYIAPDISVSSKDIDFYWNYTVSGTTTSENQINGTQTVYIIGVDDCTTYNTTALNMSIRDSETEALVSSDTEGYFKMWVDSDQRYEDFELSWDDTSNPQICIYPENATYQVYGQLEYVDTAGNYSSNRYYITDAEVDSNTEDLDLYLTPESNSFIFTVLDSTNEPVTGAYVKAMAYDVGTDSTKIVSIKKTDGEGKFAMNLQLDNEYVFWVEYEGEIIEKTGTRLMTDLTGNVIRVTFEDEFYNNYDDVAGVAGYITYENGTFTCNYNDESNTISKACMEVTQESAFGSIDIGENCTESSTGEIYVHLSPKNKTYAATCFVPYGEDDEKVITNLMITIGGDKTKWGLVGILGTFFLTVTLTMAGIYSPVISVALMVISFVISRMMGLIWIQWPVVISFVIVGIITIYRVRRR